MNGQDYTYDPNGNMVTDGLNSRSFEYNALNLISSVQNTSSSATYTWLADGTKASVTDNLGYGFEYLGSFVYQRIPTDTSLESVAFGAGRFVANSIGSVIPNYYITDHLGSVRVVFTSPTNIVAQNDYYAFGLRHSNPNLANSSSNRHLFNGKEWQSTGSVGLLDYGARMLDSYLGIWRGIDLLAENHFNMSSYVFSNNNPVRYVDMNGLDWYEYKDNDGRLRYKYEDRYLSRKERREIGYDRNIGSVAIRNGEYLSREGNRVATNDYYNTIKTMEMDFNQMSMRELRRYVNDVATPYLSGVKWNDNLPTSVDLCGSIFVVATQTNRYTSINSRNLSNQFDDYWVSQGNHSRFNPIHSPRLTGGATALFEFFVLNAGSPPLFPPSRYNESTEVRVNRSNASYKMSYYRRAGIIK